MKKRKPKEIEILVIPKKYKTKYEPKIEYL